MDEQEKIEALIEWSKKGIEFAEKMPPILINEKEGTLLRCLTAAVLAASISKKSYVSKMQSYAHMIKAAYAYGKLTVDRDSQKR